MKLINVDVAKQTAEWIVQATNGLGTRSIGIAYFVPDPAVLERLATAAFGSTIFVRSKPAEKGAPCATEMVNFEVVQGE